MNPDNIHTYPVNDIIEHELIGEACVCDPKIIPVQRDNGSYGWVIAHNSLDGREKNEKG